MRSRSKPCPFYFFLLFRSSFFSNFNPTFRNHLAKSSILLFDRRSLSLAIIIIAFPPTHGVTYSGTSTGQILTKFSEIATAANCSQLQLTPVNSSQYQPTLNFQQLLLRPTAANSSQLQPTPANSSKLQSTLANSGQLWPNLDKSSQL